MTLFLARLVEHARRGPAPRVETDRRHALCPGARPRRLRRNSKRPSVAWRPDEMARRTAARRSTRRHGTRPLLSTGKAARATSRARAGGFAVPRRLLVAPSPTSVVRRLARTMLFSRPGATVRGRTIGGSGNAHLAGARPRPQRDAASCAGTTTPGNERLRTRRRSTNHARSSGSQSAGSTCGPRPLPPPARNLLPVPAEADTQRFL